MAEGRLTWPQLFLIADIPSVGAPRIMDVLDEVLPVVPQGRVVVIDRDLPADAGGTLVRDRIVRLARLRDLTARHGARLLVTGRCDLAALVGADGVQLPERALPARDVRERFPELLVGRSCHDVQGLRVAEESDADWAFLSPVYAPVSKRVVAPPLGRDRFAAMVGERTIPVVALGGLDARRSAAMLEAGASGVAMLGGVFLSTEPQHVAKQLVTVLEGI